MPRILYIEDTENNRILITRRLGQSGYQVLTAENAEQGLTLARAERPDLILMDMGLPEVDGWNATRRLKADPELSHIPVIALTAHVMHGDREKALAAGCDDYDTKPFQFTRLLSKIEALLANSQGARTALSASSGPEPQTPARGDLPAAPDGSAPPDASSLKDRVAQARHDLCNPLGNLLAFCEILLHPDQPPRDLDVNRALRSIDETASRMVKALKQTLNPDQFLPASAQVRSLQTHLQEQAARILETNQLLIEKTANIQDAELRQNLSRMLDSAQRLINLIPTALSF